MQKTITYCDHCGAEGAAPFNFAVDKEVDAAGDTDTVTSRVDICGVCASKQLAFFILALPWPARRKFAEDILKNKKLYLSHLGSRDLWRGLETFPS